MSAILSFSLFYFLDIDLKVMFYENDLNFTVFKLIWYVIINFKESLMIRNIIFDVDGVLVDCDQCYLSFLKNTYEEFKDITDEDLPTLFPISPDNGAIKLPPNFSEDFKKSPYYFYRPLFEDTMTVLTSLKKKGLKLFTLSAARDPQKKLKWIEKTFTGLFDAFEFSPSGQPKNSALKDLLEKHSLNKEETIFIDDRFQNIRAGINVSVHTVRMQPKHSLPLPKELSHIKSLSSMTEFGKYVDELIAHDSLRLANFRGTCAKSL